jgi:hypothetical protein
LFFLGSLPFFVDFAGAAPASDAIFPAAVPIAFAALTSSVSSVSGGAFCFFGISVIEYHYQSIRQLPVLSNTGMSLKEDPSSTRLDKTRCGGEPRKCCRLENSWSVQDSTGVREEFKSCRSVPLCA